MKKPNRRPAAANAKNGKIIFLSLAMLVVGIILGNLISEGTSSPASITQAQASEKALSYINSALQGKAAAKVLSINESDGMYSIGIDIGGTKYNSFMTKDGRMLFPSGIMLDEQPGSGANQNTAVSIPKSDKPKVELFVMSLCPYGVQAEGFMKPVVDLFGNKIDMKVRFIALSENNSVQSLHGAAEAREDLRQICIMKNYPEKYWNYLSSFNSNCFPIYKNDTALDSCWKSSASSAGIDSAKTDSCANVDALAFLKLDEQAAASYGVSGSPTLVINGAMYGGARSSEDFKNAICSAFNNPSEECSQSVGTATQPATAATSGCG